MHRFKLFLVFFAVMLYCVTPVTAQTSTHGPVPPGYANPLTPWGYPLIMGGVDPSGIVQYFPISAGGKIIVTEPYSPLYSYALAATSGTATVVGFFVNYNGVETGPNKVATQYTFSVGTGGSTFTNLYNTAASISANTPLPADFAGFKCVVSVAAMYFNNSANTTGTIGVVPASGPGVPITNTTTTAYFVFGDAK